VASVSVAAGNSVGNQINLSVSNFTGTVNFTYSVAPTSGITAAFSPTLLTANGSTVVTVSVPANTAAGAYLVTVTGSSSNLTPRNANFTVNITAPSVTPRSAYFGGSQFLSGTAPANLTSLPNWRFETRLHLSAATLGPGASDIAGLGNLRLLIYKYIWYGQLSYSLMLSNGTSGIEFWQTLPDIFIRVQRDGSQLVLRAWKVEMDGSLSVPAGTSEVTMPWSSGTTLSPGFSLGAGNGQTGFDRLPLTGAMAFFRFFDSAASNATLPNQCDTASALIRYEFEDNLTNAGTGSASLAPTGAITYQNTLATSCSAGGAPPSFSLVPGAQSPLPVTQAQSASFPITVNRSNFAGQVSITGCTGPTGVTCSQPVAPPGTNQVTVNVQTSANTPASTIANPHTVTLNASATGVPNASVPLSLVVASIAPPFGIQVTPPTLSFAGSGNQNLTVTLYPGSGFNGNVNFTCAPPAGATIPSQLTCVAPNPASDLQPQRTFSIVAAAGAPQGTYSFVLTGTGPVPPGGGSPFVASAGFQVSITAVGIRGFVYPDYREISTNPGAFYQFLSTVEGSSNSQVNWSISPTLGGLTTTYPLPASPPTSATAGPASYVFYYPPSSFGSSPYLALSGTPVVGGQPGSATILLRATPYGPPIVCRPPNTPGCAGETILPASLSVNAGFSFLRMESQYSGSYSVWNDARLHRQFTLAFALNPANAWDSGVNACVVRVIKSLGYGTESQTLYLEGGTSPAGASIGPGSPNASVTNGVCTVNRQSSVATNFLGAPTKAWFDLNIRFNAPSAPRYLFYSVDTYNNTSSGTVLLSNTPLPVNP